MTNDEVREMCRKLLNSIYGERAEGNMGACYDEYLMELEAFAREMMVKGMRVCKEILDGEYEPNGNMAFREGFLCGWMQCLDRGCVYGAGEKHLRRSSDDQG